MRTAGHDMGDGFAIVSVARAVSFEIRVEPFDPIGHRIDRLQSDRDAVVRERETDVGEPGFTAEIALVDPHPVQHAQTSRQLRLRHLLQSLIMLKHRQLII